MALDLDDQIPDNGQLGMLRIEDGPLFLPVPSDFMSEAPLCRSIFPPIPAGAPMACMAYVILTSRFEIA